MEEAKIQNEIPSTSSPIVKPGFCLHFLMGRNEGKNGSFMAIRMRIHQKFSSSMTPSWTRPEAMPNLLIVMCIYMHDMVYLLLLLYCGALVGCPGQAGVGEDGACSNPLDIMHACSLAIYLNHSLLHTYSASTFMMPQIYSQLSCIFEKNIAQNVITTRLVGHAPHLGHVQPVPFEHARLLKCNTTMTIIGNSLYFIIAFCINSNSVMLPFTR